MALVSRPAKRALVNTGSLCGVQRRGAYEWGVRSTRKPESPPLDRVSEIPGLEPITYKGKMHFLPGLARPVFPPWDSGWKNPRFHRSAPAHEQPLYKDRPCYIFHQRCRLLEGVKQALWLTKSKLIEGLPKQVLSLADAPGNHIANQEERVLNAISHARLWHSTEDIPKRKSYCPVIVDSLIQLCKSQVPKFPALAERVCAQNYSLSTAWTRESVLLQVRGTSGARLSAKGPLPPVASREEVEATRSHVLETFYPVSPTISLQECNVYDVKDDAGFWDGYTYPHPHTLYFLEKANVRSHRFPPEQLRAKMVLFAFGNALAQARLLYGSAPTVLEQPVVVQSVGTDGRVFQFLVLQLNTTDLSSTEGVKNLVWMDADQLLYQHFRCLPVTKKGVLVEPVGPIGFQPETFRKFLALYLHGAV